MRRTLLSETERLDWLRLSRTENVGPATFFRLLEFFGSAGHALQALPSLSKRGGRTKPLVAASRQLAEQEFEALSKIGARLIAACEPDYPLPLAAIEDRPPVITVLGHTSLLKIPTIGIVGARDASLNGRKLASQFAESLGKHGYVAASGLARGIDTAVHLASLPTGTIAAVAGGIDTVYPEENRALYERIATEGAIIAEAPFGTQPIARHFPRRNRIISGLSMGTLVVEASPKSGSLITAEYAKQQGRLVFAVPGSPLDPRGQGCNGLLKDGAVLAETADDILKAIAKRPVMTEADLPLFMAEPPALAPEDDTRKALAQVLELLSPAPITVDELIRECQFSTSIVLTVLLELELAGRIERHFGNKVSLL
jgi:DNA processing protein